MKRISSNESFPRNIILSIDPSEENYKLNLTRFRYIFQEALSEGKAPQEAVEIATDRLKSLVEKRKQIFIPKPGNKKDGPVVPRVLRDPEVPEAPKEKPPTQKTLLEEGNLIKNAPKIERKEKITKRLSDLTGETGEKLEQLWQTFCNRRKNVETDSLALKKTINEYNSAKEPEVVNPPTIDEIRSCYNIISNLEPENREHNIEQFKKDILKGMSLTSALSKIRNIIAARNYMRENDIPVTATNTKIFLVSDGDFELAARRVKERDEAGKLGIDVNNLRNPSPRSDDYVIYNGERISLHRLVSSLFLGKTSEKQIKMMYAIIKRNVFDAGMSVDEAVDLAYKRLNITHFRNQLKEEFPEDPYYAETVFEEYYVDENMSFQDALEATRKDLGKNPSN
jgi:hypothetical protein